MQQNYVCLDGPGIQGSRWNCPCLPPSIAKATHPSSIPPLNYLSWTSGTTIAKSWQRSISKVTTFLGFVASVVERAPCRSQDRRVAHYLPKRTQDSPVQSSPRLCIATFPLLTTIVHCIVVYCIVLYCIVALNCVATAAAAIMSVIRGID